MKKVPIRKCIVSRESFPKDELTRVVCNKNNQIFVDIKGNEEGRGDYLKLTLKNIEKAKKNNSLNRALRCKVPEKVYDDLLKLL